ncbi:MAG: MBL fold metallo-hydrolase [Acidobacteriia bacterium]|nr:MBL fold metallo-hydrolase [Terriglobia bacterium]
MRITLGTVAAAFSENRLGGASAIEQITPSIAVVHGPVNGVLIARPGATLAVYGDPRDVPAVAKMVLFTHHRRDVVWAGRGMVRQGAMAVAPEAEKDLFTGVAGFWNQYQTARFHDYANQSSRILAEPMALGRTVRGGDTVEGLQVMDTPGYTRGAVSYLIETEGRRIACTGDLIYGGGRILDLFSLQDALPELKENGYHGYAARAADVVASLRKIVAWQPDMLIPARGPLIPKPAEAIDTLIRRIESVFASHFAIDAMRWTRGDDKIHAMAARVLANRPVEWMPMAERIITQLPDWIIAITNSRLLVSRTGASFLVDCGNQQVVEEVRRLKLDGRIKQLDGIYITHYHDDHTDLAQATADEFHARSISAARCATFSSTPRLIGCLASPPTRFAAGIPCRMPRGRNGMNLSSLTHIFPVRPSITAVCSSGMTAARRFSFWVIPLPLREWTIIACSIGTSCLRERGISIACAKSAI